MSKWISVTRRLIPSVARRTSGKLSGPTWPEVWTRPLKICEGPPPASSYYRDKQHPKDKLAHSGLKSKAGDVVEMLRKMEVGLEPLNQTVAWAKENGVQDWFEAATYTSRRMDTGGRPRQHRKPPRR